MKHAALADYSTFKIGGKAEIIYEPHNVDALISVLHECAAKSVPFFVVGGGSNVFFPDEGLPGKALISTAGLNNFRVDGNKIIFGAGLAMNDAVESSLAAGLAGLEHFYGLPGSVGGAAFMNARCYEKEMSDVIYCVDYIDADIRNGEPYARKTYFFNKADWNYKHSPFQAAKRIIMQVTFTLTYASLCDLEKAKEAARFYKQDRIEKRQFEFPSCGSVFKNNRSFGKPAGKIIDEANLKGFAIGDAQIAPWHGNIIINRGNAKAADVLALIAHVQKTVQEKFGYELKPEIIFAN